MITMKKDSHVYFIRLGNSSQEYVKEAAFDKNSPKLFIGYDLEVTKDQLNKCIEDVITSDEYKKNQNPIDYISYFNGLEMVKNEKFVPVPDRAKKALCAFALARPNIDYFFTFYKKKMYWGTPKEEPNKVDQVRLKEKGPYFRFRAFEWHDKYEDSTDAELFSNQVTGIISRINRFQETVYQLSEEESFFSERNVFFDQINGRLPRIVEAAFKLQLGIEQDPIEDDIEDQVSAIVDTQSETCNSLIRNLCNYLHPSAFEKFVDVAYSSQGYMRCSELGGTMEAIDMEYLRFIDVNAPEHIAVQVKSTISESVLNKTLETISKVIGQLECHIVTHDSNEDKLKNVVDKCPYASPFKFVKLDELIENSDKKSMVAFLIITLAGRDVLDGLLKYFKNIA